MGAIGVTSGVFLALLLGLTGPSDGLKAEGEDLFISSRVQAVVNISGPMGVFLTALPLLILFTTLQRLLAPQ